MGIFCVIKVGFGLVISLVEESSRWIPAALSSWMLSCFAARLEDCASLTPFSIFACLGSCVGEAFPYQKSRPMQFFRSKSQNCFTLIKVNIFLKNAFITCYPTKRQLRNSIILLYICIFFLYLKVSYLNKNTLYMEFCCHFFLFKCQILIYLL